LAATSTDFAPKSTRPIRRSTRPITGNRRSLSEDGRPSALSVADLAADRTARRNVLGCREHQTHRGFRCYLPLLARCVLPPAELSPVHTSDNVAGFGDNVAVFGDIVAGVDGALRCAVVLQTPTDDDRRTASKTILTPIPSV